MKIPTSNNFTILILLCLWLSPLYAQSPRLYTNADGLADTRINGVTFDSDNFLWVSTTLGLSRFDGQTFHNYTQEDGNPYALNGNRVNLVYLDSDGEHWVGANDGLYWLCRTRNSFTRFNPDTVGFTITVTGIEEHPAAQRKLLAGTAGFGVWVFDKDSLDFDRPASQAIRELQTKMDVTLLQVDKHQRAWIFYHNGFDVIDLRSMQNINDKITLPNSLQSNQIVVQSIAFDQMHDCFYLGTVGQGLYKCSGHNLQIEALNLPELARKNITALCINPQGELMVGTEAQGLYRVDLFKNEIELITSNDCPVDLLHAKVHSIQYNQDRDLCLGIFQKGVLFWPSSTSLFSYTPIMTNAEQAYNLGNISSFASMPDGTRVYGADGGGLMVHYASGRKQHYNSHNSCMVSDAVMALATTPEGRVYIATYLSGLYELNLNTAKLSRIPELADLNETSIMTLAYDDQKKQLFIGTLGRGLYRYEPNTHKCELISNDPGHRWAVKLFINSHRQLWFYSEGSLSHFDLTNNMVCQWVRRPRNARLVSIEEDPKTHQMWLASDHGLYKYDDTREELEMVDIDAQANREAFSNIMHSDDGHLWLTSNRGLLAYNPIDGKVSRYIDPEIAAIGEFSRNAAVRWPDGTFSLGGDNGVLSFRPEQVLSYVRQPRPIYFTQLWIDNEAVDYSPNLSSQENVLNHALWKADTLTLPAQINNFSISFAMQEYCDPVGIQYSYILEGYDKEWHTTHGQDVTANYSSLPFGHYTFKVKNLADNPTDNTSSAQIVVIVRAPWYVSPWAIALWIILLLVAILLTYRYFRIRQHQKRVIRRAQQARHIKAAKLRMFADVTNEIRTPLTLIISPLHDLINRSCVDKSTMEIYEKLYDNALRIFMLVNQQHDIAEANRTILEELQQNRESQSIQQTEDKQLAASLHDELKEKQQLRARRSNMGIDYTSKRLESADEALLKRLVDCINTNISDPDFNVERLSAQVGVSRVHLNRKMKDLIDMSPSSLIRSVRLKQAANILLNSNVTIAEVAYSVGYTSPSYFTNNFAQYYGITPRDMLQEYQKDPDNEKWQKMLE